MALPMFVVLKSKSNSKYLSYVEQPDEETYLQFCGEDVFALDVKYEIHYTQWHANQGHARNGPARRGHANHSHFVHIRYCYGNRYLVGSDDKWIVAEAKRAEKGTSKPSCTLFKPIITGATSNTFQFRHVHLQRLLSIDMDTDTLSADPTNPTVECVVINLESLFKLLKHVVYKDTNGRYLRCRQIKNHQFMQFIKEDEGEGTAMHEVFVTGDGYFLIKSHGHDKFWRCDPTTKWVWNDSDSFDPSGKDIDVPNI